MTLKVELEVFEVGGSDAARRNGDNEQNYIHQERAALRIRDNSGVLSSVFHRANHDVTPFSKLRVEFWFYPDSMENGEDFFLEYSSDGGSSWDIVQEYVRGNDQFDGKYYFQNGIFYFDSVEFKEPEFCLTNQAKIRFRCDAIGNGDRIYIDEVSFQGSAYGREPPSRRR